MDDPKKTVAVEGPAAQTARRAGKTLQAAAVLAPPSNYPLESKRVKDAAAYFERREKTRQRIAELCKRSVAR